MKAKLKRATRNEIMDEIEARMSLLKLDKRLVSHIKNGEVYYSYVNECLPLTDEMKSAYEPYAEDHVPYHMVYSESSTSGRLLYVLYVSSDKADWKQEKEPIGKNLEIPCDIFFLDKGICEPGKVLLTSIAEDAFRPEERRPVLAEPQKNWNFFPDPRNAWLSVKSFFESRCL